MRIHKGGRSHHQRLEFAIICVVEEPRQAPHHRATDSFAGRGVGNHDRNPLAQGLPESAKLRDDDAERVRELRDQDLDRDRAACAAPVAIAGNPSSGSKPETGDVRRRDARWATPGRFRHPVTPTAAPLRSFLENPMTESAFGWVMTAHKAQGSQWENVIVWDDGLDPQRDRPPLLALYRHHPRRARPRAAGVSGVR